MPKIYDASGSQGGISTGYITVCGLTSATTVRPEIFEVKTGCPDAPADNTLNWLIQRYTAAGTSTGATPSARDPAYDGLHAASFGYDHSAEPTYTASKFPLSIPPLHQKNSLIWQAYSGEGIILPATANNGVGIQCKSPAFTGNVFAGIAWKE